MSGSLNTQWKPRHYPPAAVPLLLLFAAALFAIAGGASAAISAPGAGSTPGSDGAHVAAPGGAGSGGLMSTASATCEPVWSIVDHPAVGAGNSRFDGVAAIGPDDIWAVGSYGASNNYDATLAEHWNGTEWITVATPNVPPYGTVLFGVAAIATDDVWAVGWYQSEGANLQALTVHWDGTQWAIVDSPVAGANSELRAVAAVNADDVWAVGYSGTGTYQTLIEHWNGTEWSIVTSPNVGADSNQLNGVSAGSATDVWAVGTSGGWTETSHTLILRLVGATWVVESSPNVGSLDNYLDGVVAVSPDEVWAAGRYVSSVGSGTLTLHRTSTQQWEVVPSVDPDTDNALNDVGATAPGDVWTVGYYYGATTGTLTEHWDGTTWAQVPSPGMTGGANSLVSVAPVSPGDVWAVGWYFSSGRTFHTLIEHYVSPCQPTVTPTVAATETPIATPTTTGANTPTPAATATPCTIEFTDVPAGSTFYQYVRCLACRGVLGGYADSTFRPNNNITRGQIAKVVSNAAAFDDNIPQDRQTYTDVPSTNTFWLWIERLAVHEVMSGYQCGVDPNEPCDPQNRPYFRWANNATRAQLAKIDSNAAGYSDDPTTQTFSDVPSTQPFYVWIERLATRGIMGGYACGGVGEPCDPQNRPYFRPYNNVTRGQAAKIVSNTFYPSCSTPGR